MCGGRGLRHGLTEYLSHVILVCCVAGQEHLGAQLVGHRGPCGGLGHDGRLTRELGAHPLMDDTEREAPHVLQVETLDQTPQVTDTIMGGWQIGN